jgi:hypothetical protein
MQVSALNLIIAAQQARGTSVLPSALQTKAPETEAPKVNKSEAQPSDFAPLSFGSKSFGAHASAAQPVASGAAPAVYPANAPVGSQIDIRV